MIINQDEILHQTNHLKNMGYESLIPQDQMADHHLQQPGLLQGFFELKMGSKDSASPHASFILTRIYFF